ncbi:MAG: hypothetical protein K5919_00330 [Clostridiales bacterium]|nr:hypothetical protein [Clostridiales bacterium]
MKRIFAIVLALALVLSLSCTAFATEPTLASLNDNGVVGDTAFTTDKPTNQGKMVNIRKELTVFNPDESFVYGPAFTYTYTVTPGSAQKDITDATSQHASGLATSTKTLAGITTGVTVNSGTAGSATSATGTLAWTNADILDADDAGAANYKNVVIDFTNVVFTQPGVYRYVITETPAADDASYAAAGITEGSGNRVRYLDVYVMRSSDYGKGANGDPSETNRAGWWMIYGYVCFYNDTAIDAADLSTTPIKTTGFVAGTSDGNTAVTADQYHTYNLTVGKTLVGDDTMNSHKFPFDVAWANPTGSASGTFQYIVETTGTAQVTKTDVAATTSINGTDVAAHMTVGGANAVSTANKDGGPSIAHEATVKYIGIPQAAYATVTETNDVTGTTYTTTAKETIGSDSATDVEFTAASTAALSTDSKTATTDQDDTAVYAQATTVTADSNYAVQFTNKLAVISPTGIAFRIAPYALMLVAGVTLFIILAARRRKTKENND